MQSTLKTSEKNQTTLKKSEIDFSLSGFSSSGPSFQAWRLRQWREPRSTPSPTLVTCVHAPEPDIGDFLDNVDSLPVIPLTVILHVQIAQGIYTRNEWRLIFSLVSSVVLACAVKHEYSSALGHLYYASVLAILIDHCLDEEFWKISTC